MIGYLKGKIIYADQKSREAIILPEQSAIGYSVSFCGTLREGEDREFYISHIFKEAGQELYAFNGIIQKKVFELLLEVRGIGPKSAFTLCAALEPAEIISAVKYERHSILAGVPGLGAKSATQIVLDLKKKIRPFSEWMERTQMPSQGEVPSPSLPPHAQNEGEGGPAAEGREGVRSKKKSAKTQEQISFFPSSKNESIYDEALAACISLGFKEEKVEKIALHLLKNGSFSRTEDLLQNILKEL